MLLALQTALDGLTHAPDEPPKDLDIHTPAATGAYAWPHYHQHFRRERPHYFEHWQPSLALWSQVHD